MHLVIRKIWFFVFFIISTTYAQNPLTNNQSKFDVHLYRAGNEYRSASGIPGPKYWQNGADYYIEAELDDQNHLLTGKVVITYYNNSPDPLDYLWLHLEQNRFTKDSRGTLTTPIQGTRYSGDIDGGFQISNVVVKTGKQTSTSYWINDTRMQIQLQEPLAAQGGKAEISMNFSFKIPQRGMDRMGRLDTSEGTIYSLAQWYPKMAVYDDIKGWNIEPYLGAGEFYLGYGNFHYKITVPYDHIVVGSGKLVNETTALSKEIISRMRKAEKSDQTVMLIAENEVGNTTLTRPKQSGKITWEFKMENTRDVAFASSKAFIWDAARINLPNGKSALAQSVYPKESNGDNGWERSTEYTKASVEYYSKNIYPYPYPVAVNVASNVGGMEYPGLAFCSSRSKGSRLWGVTDHEFGHIWYPMIVGTNERLHVWLDEGLNMLINHYSTVSFNQSEYASRMDREMIIAWMNSSMREPISTYPDIAQHNNLGFTGYYKPAYGLFMLREYILGHDRFDAALKAYTQAWAFKHPRPEDFFNIFENVSGEDLSWFWKHWFYGNDPIDLAIEAVDKVRTDYLITFRNFGMPMPVHFEVTYADQTKERLYLPVEVWHRQNHWVYLLETQKEIIKIEIDPDRILADSNETNNSWTP